MIVLMYTVPAVIIAFIIAFVIVKCGKKSNNSLTPNATFPHKTVIMIDGMSCGHCSARVEAAIAEKGLKGKVNLEKKCAEVLSKTPLNQAEMSLMIQDLGFTPVQFIVEQ